MLLEGREREQESCGFGGQISSNARSFQHVAIRLLQDLSGKMKVRHNYLSQITKNFQPCRPQLVWSAEESPVFYLANDHNQSFIIYRIKDWGWFDSVVIQFKKLLPPETIGRELMQGKPKMAHSPFSAKKLFSLSKLSVAVQYKMDMLYM